MYGLIFGKKIRIDRRQIHGICTDFCIRSCEPLFLDFFFMESEGWVGPQGPQLGTPDLPGPGPSWGLSFFGALRALGPSGAPEPGPWGPRALIQI